MYTKLTGLLVMKSSEYPHNEVKDFTSTGSLLSMYSICTELYINIIA